MHDGLVSFHASVKLLQLVQSKYPDRSIYQDQVELVRPCFREQGNEFLVYPIFNQNYFIQPTSTLTYFPSTCVYLSVVLFVVASKDAMNWRKSSIDRPDWVSFYETNDPKTPEILGRNSIRGDGDEGESGGDAEVNQDEGTIVQGVAVIKQAILVDSPLYLQVTYYRTVENE